MRTRNRSIARRTVNIPSGSVYPTEFTRCDTGAVTLANLSRPALVQVSSGFDEEINDNLGRSKQNLVTHRKHDYDYNDAEVQAIFGSSAGGPPGVMRYFVPHAWYDGDIQYVKGLHDWNISVAGDPPFWTMLDPHDPTPVINSLLQAARQQKADALLNIVEANQIWPSLKSFAIAAPIAEYNWKAIRKIIKGASGMFLAWKFGIGPILSDAMAIHRFLPKLATDLKRHVDQDTTRYSKVIPLDAKFTTVTTYAQGNLNGKLSYVFSRQGRQMGPCEVRYVLSVKPNKPKYATTFFQKVDHAMARFASSPATLAWELVPFSFVADWLVDIRGALSALDNWLGVEPYHIVGFTKSRKYHVATDNFLENYTPCGSATALIQSLRTGTDEYKHYERSNVLGRHSVATNPRFGKNQAGISAALIAQKLSQLSSSKR